MEYQSISEKILEMAKEDFALRNKLIQGGELGEGYSEAMKFLNNNNAKILNEIVDKIGYPTVDKVGKDANEAAWLIIQHAIEQPEFMTKCVELLKKAVDENNADPKNLAYLTDRIAVLEGKSQLYGTQFDWDKDGNLSPNPFDNLKKVNERRKYIGLNTIEEQTEIMRRRMLEEKQTPPADFEKRKQEIEAWKKSVRWLK